MSDELEAAGLASAGALKRGGAAGEASEACRNCGAPVAAKYCERCGQLAADFHRPIWSLVSEGLADTLAFDGRIARTLPALLFRPGKVTRAYLEGKRARYVPPFRLFLLASLLFFSIAFAFGDRLGIADGIRFTPDGSGGFNLNFGDAQTSIDDRPEFLREDGSLDHDKLREAALDDADDMSAEDRARAEATVERAARLYENQDGFFAAIEDWLPRLSLALFPVFALVLTILYAWRRKVFVYDHLIATLHFQSWFYLASALAMLLAWFVTPWALLVLALATPIYVYRLLREVYGTGRFLSLLRTGLLLFAALIALVSLLSGVVAIGALEASA